MIAKKRLLGMLSVLVAGLLLAGCMGDDEEATDDTLTNDGLGGDGTGTDGTDGAGDGGLGGGTAWDEMGNGTAGTNDTAGAQPPTPNPPESAAQPSS